MRLLLAAAYGIQSNTAPPALLQELVRGTQSEGMRRYRMKPLVGGSCETHSDASDGFSIDPLSLLNSLCLVLVEEGCYAGESAAFEELEARAAAGADVSVFVG